MEYSIRLRELREDLDLSQATVAQLIQVGQRTYSDYERGITRIPVEKLIILAKLYDVDMNYICGVSDNREKFPK